MADGYWTFEDRVDALRSRIDRLGVLCRLTAERDQARAERDAANIQAGRAIADAKQAAVERDQAQHAADALRGLAVRCQEAIGHSGWARTREETYNRVYPAALDISLTLRHLDPDDDVLVCYRCDEDIPKGEPAVTSGGTALHPACASDWSRAAR